MEKLREFGCEWYGRPYKAVHGRTVRTKGSRPKLTQLDQVKRLKVGVYEIQDSSASSSRGNDDYIKRSDLDALFKMLKENGNTYEN
ncbi:hypothetical protein IGI04_042484 [Brassica rapa subsp. trilocularis]|uniref:Uncharacterized protein n=1 Tax=Brassica rapa subsp. trilocularis TaxID=1813537 RepID=A0ABQ7KM53_BRACM|nr:hypothetical protein IGI04_042484 [Brassica rapa subsp. trilocularis]